MFVGARSYQTTASGGAEGVKAWTRMYLAMREEKQEKARSWMPLKVKTRKGIMWSEWLEKEMWHRGMRIMVPQWRTKEDKVFLQGQR